MHPQGMNYIFLRNEIHIRLELFVKRSMQFNVWTSIQNSCYDIS